ncbi:MAG: hypothetical protein ACON5H_01575 [Akkermansiaceae bacterium]
MRILLLSFIGLLASCSDKPAPSSPGIPVYQTMHHLTLNGTMFHFNHNGRLYLGCSIHQGGMGKNAQLLREGQNDAVVVKKRIHAQKDLHVWTYDEATILNNDPLPYLKGADIRVGDRIYFLRKKQRHPAVVIATPSQSGSYHYIYQANRPFAAAGWSGSPVFSERTGTVIGVLQTANSKTKATRGGFEALQMP